MTVKNILAADDEQGVLDFLKETLEYEGYKVILADNGQEAVAIAEKNPIDIAILDLKMPVMDGLDTLKAIKIIDPGIEVLIMTAYGDIESLNQIMEHGAFDYILKPFHRTEIAHVVRNALSKREIIRENNRLIADLKDRIVQLEKDFEERTHQLRESQIKYKQIVESSNDMIWVCQDDKLKFVNPQTLDLTGYTKEEIQDKKLSKLLHREDRCRVEDKHTRSLQGDDGAVIYHFRIKKKTGEFLWLEANTAKTIWEDKPATISFMRDITDRKQAEEALKQSEEKYRMVVENAHEGIIVIQDGMPKFLNPTVMESSGYSEEELLSGSFVEFIHPEDRDMVVERHSKRLRGEEVPRHYQFRVINKEGRIRWVEINAVSVSWEGKPATLSFLNDITDRRRAEGSLAEEKERLAVTLRSIGDGVITTDIAGRIVLINKATEDMTGWIQEEAAEKALGKVFHIIDEKTRAASGSPVEKAIKSGRISGLSGPTILIARDGTERYVSASAAPIRDKESQMIGVILVFRDITEIRKMEEELLKVEKLESVGVLAGGIAHDFNNILTTILGNISLAKMGMSEEEEVFGLLEEAEKASLNARALTQQLLTFSRGGAPVRKMASIRDIITDSARFVLRGSKVRCDCSISDDLWAAEVDQGQISQVIHNIILNADQAMPEGGVVQVRAENVFVDSGQRLAVEPGRYIKISIRDQGSGIREEHLSKIFDPYFTTKHKGSGLGLATAYSIIKRHDGHISGESQLGAGTTFQIYLRASERKIPKSKRKAQKPVAGQGKILLMDDEEMVRKVAGEMLQRLGYDVEFAKDGSEAIDLYLKVKESGEAFDAVIMDLTIPGGMGGKETIEKLLEADPQVRAIVSSGYSTDPIMGNFMDYGFCSVVAKPYNLEELSKTLNEVLKTKDTGSPL